MLLHIKHYTVSKTGEAFMTVTLSRTAKPSKPRRRQHNTPTPSNQAHPRFTARVLRGELGLGAKGLGNHVRTSVPPHVIRDDVEGRTNDAPNAAHRVISEHQARKKWYGAAIPLQAAIP